MLSAPEEIGMDNDQYFEKLDNYERTYAPQELPAGDPEQVRTLVDEDVESRNQAAASSVEEPPAAAPVANVGSSASGLAAPPNIGNMDRGGASGDPKTQARDPLDANAGGDAI